jgi:nucleotide-binding universal stress UspA family protein
MGDRWIVGVDGSFGSRSALAWALHQSIRRDAQLDIVHAYHQPSATRLLSAIRGSHAPESGAATAALQELDAAVADLTGDRVVDRRIVEGAPGKVLIEAAADASLLVVGRHGSGGGWQHSLGSVGRYCVLRSTRPTVVVPTDWDSQRADEIVVGFDGSANACAAVRWCLEFSNGSSTVRAVIAIEVAPWLDEQTIRLRLDDELQQEEGRLLTLMDAADPQGLVRRSVVVRGARPALARAAEGADLLVVGAHGAGRIGSAVAGSVSTWMLDVSPCPIVVVPHPIEDNRTEES